ncbi:carboxymuconolactone decarboxylase family protein [Paracoccus sp. MC1854]|uniref:carboxymuconolactone decarboxylase family protein n=1 Tax=Paracoccus sp. MC1854 TaxID=2760306 RepID=UPI001C71EFFA|nr:carboxymuconolactone decarboxylase family protein [Paracoccus sp. MC1854]
MKHLLAAAILGLVLGTGAVAQDQATDTRGQIEAALGMVPSMFDVLPEAGLAGTWGEFSALQLSKDAALDNKTKELMGLAVASQIPCSYCIYFHTAAARAHGATDEEIAEAVAMAAIVRHWSTVLNGMQVDQARFRSEVDTLMSAAAEASASASATSN